MTQNGLPFFPRRRRQSIGALTVVACVLRCISLTDLPAFAQETPQPTSPPRTTASTTKVFLCIYADHLKDAADQWVAYRQKTGWKADGIPVSSILTNVENQPQNDPVSNDSAAHIQSYIRRRFALSRKEQHVKGGWFAVLLLGDVNAPKDHMQDRSVVPTFHFEKPDDATLRLSWFERDDYATDAPYQLADDRDEIPDFLVGRVPAQTNSDALTLLNRVIIYETNPGPGAWNKRINYIASEARFGAIDKMIERMFIAMVDQVVPYDYDVSMTYANPASPYCAPPSQFGDYVMQRINEGALLVNYVGHGAPKMLDVLDWGENRYPICTQAQAAAQLNIDPRQAPVVLIIACSTAMYDRPSGEPSLAETMLFHPRGPVAVIAGSRITHPYPNTIYQKDLTEQLGCMKRATIGGVDLAATRQLIKLSNQTDQKIERIALLIALQGNWESTPAQLRTLHASLYNLLGDPATAIPHPKNEMADLVFNPETTEISGQVMNISKPVDLVVTIETPRNVLAHPDEMIAVTGRDDPDLERKARHNYEIANNFVLWGIQIRSSADGRFTTTIEQQQFDEISRGFDQLWIKVAAYRSVPGETRNFNEPDTFDQLIAIASLNVTMKSKQIGR